MNLQVRHATDLTVVREVLYDGQYELPRLDKPRVIVDAGSHIGASVIWFASRYPGCRVVGFEASPATFRCLKDNVRAFPNVEVHNIALGTHDGEAPFFEATAPWASSLRGHGQGTSSGTVPVLSLDSVLRLAGTEVADLLKLDIEGAEYDVLRACPPDPNRVKRIVGELHSWMPDLDFTDTDFFALLDAYDVVESEVGGDRVFRATHKFATISNGRQEP